MRQLPRTWIEPGGRLSRRGLQWIEHHPGAVLLESNAERRDEESLMFVKPVSVIQASSLDEVEGSLLLLDRAVGDGYHVAGFLAYEAGYAFESTLPRDRVPALPLVWFGVFEKPFRIPRFARHIGASGKKSKRTAHIFQEPQFEASVSEEEYFDAVGKIREYIADGDTYQVNYSFRLQFPLVQPVSALYERLRKMQSAAYSAFLNIGSHVIVSLSPELFYRRDGSMVVLRPMKGTAPRGRTLAEDETNRSWLESSEKNRAENLMIVDLLRNDLGKLARPGSVRVRRFFDIERYETVFQATSTIEGALRKEITDGDMIRSLFPSGSVTGAPKIRTMQIIHELEPDVRGIYTGAIGTIAPHRKAVFNVAIRTVVVDNNSRRAEYGVGSGVVHDSGTQDEYQECLLKAQFLHEPPEEFSLFETIRWDPVKGWSLLSYHLRRLRSSAEYFDFRFSRAGIIAALRKRETEFGRRGTPMRVKLILDKDGFVRTDSRSLKPLAEPVTIGLSAVPVDSADRFLYHKTTRRSLYDSAVRIAERNALFDILFRNQQGEITEGARSNVILRTNQQYVTPPLASGVLAGTFREHLFRIKGLGLREKVLYPDDVLAADAVFVCNALRGLVPAKFSGEEFTIS